MREQPKITCEFSPYRVGPQEPWFRFHGRWADDAHDEVIKRVAAEFNVHFARRQATRAAEVDAGVMATQIAMTMVARGELLFFADEWRLSPR